MSPAIAAARYYEEGQAHYARGRLDEAVAAYDNALRIRPDFPEALRAGGAILRERGFAEGALRFFAEAVRLRPAYLDAILDLGNLLHALGRDEEALATVDAGLAVLPGQSGLLTNRGAILHALGRLDDACATLEAAIAADDRLPQAHLNYAGVLMRQFRHAEALPVVERALALQPHNPQAHANRGLALKMLGRFDAAAAALESALAQDPQDSYALTNRGELRLLLGDYERGLRDYQARFATAAHEATAFRRVAPLYAGQPLAGLAVAAFADAGAGDIIQFVRFVPLLAAAGAKVTVICRRPLQHLVRAATDARVVDAPDATERFDCSIPFTNLPHVLKTRVATIPAAVPYLAAEPDRVAAWAARLGAGGFRVGLCWRGSQDWRADRHRSLPLDAFAGLAAIPGVRLVSLQMDGDSAAPFPLERFEDVDAGPDAFVDTAAIMANLDLVVSCDTSCAHLAGALARPCFTLLRAVPEWRWMLERDDTPWYPTMRLFRQDRAGDWDAPVARLVAAVRARVVHR